jgi:4-hydroxyproline epimerase
LTDGNKVSVQNVPSFRHIANVSLELKGYGSVVGDVAWGGNWFFLTDAGSHSIELSNVAQLTDFAWQIRDTLNSAGITGEGGAEIDHIELLGSSRGHANSRNFVLCPGKAYDRSPCGTGTSAKIACLYAAGKISEYEIWRQESITGSVFEGYVRKVAGKIIPTITGSAFVNAESTLLLSQADPLCFGIRS